MHVQTARLYRNTHTHATRLRSLDFPISWLASPAAIYGGPGVKKLTMQSLPKHTHTHSLSTSKYLISPGNTQHHGCPEPYFWLTHTWTARRRRAACASGAVRVHRMKTDEPEESQISSQRDARACVPLIHKNPSSEDVSFGPFLGILLPESLFNLKAPSCVTASVCMTWRENNAGAADCFLSTHLPVLQASSVICSSLLPPLHSCFRQFLRSPVRSAVPPRHSGSEAQIPLAQHIARVKSHYRH